MSCVWKKMPQQEININKLFLRKNKSWICFNKIRMEIWETFNIKQNSSLLLKKYRNTHQLEISKLSIDKAKVEQDILQFQFNNIQTINLSIVNLSNTVKFHNMIKINNMVNLSSTLLWIKPNNYIFLIYSEILIKMKEFEPMSTKIKILF